MSDSDAFNTWWWSEARTVACAKQHAWEVWQAAVKALRAENERLQNKLDALILTAEGLRESLVAYYKDERLRAQVIAENERLRAAATQLLRVAYVGGGKIVAPSAFVEPLRALVLALRDEASRAPDAPKAFPPGIEGE